MENSTASLALKEMKIVHAIGGRIRLRCISDRARDLLPTIAQDLRERAGIRKVTTNKTTGSLLVEFDPNNFSQGQLSQLLQPLGVALPSPAKVSTSTDSSSSQSRVYEQLLSLVPPLLGLAIVRGIGVSGWKSFLTYLVATGFIRQIWEQVVPAASSQLKSTSTPAVLEKPKLNAADESKNSNLPVEDSKITPRQEKETFSTDDESPSAQEKPLESKKRNPSKRKPKKADIASSNPQTEQSTELVVTSEAEATTEPKTEEVADSIKEITTENESYWSKFKSSMLSMLLQLMEKLPVQTA